jgi:hypothetical protein
MDERKVGMDAPSVNVDVATRERVAAPTLA